jgi:hypothetical protein
MATQIERSAATSNINVLAILAMAAQLEEQREPAMAESIEQQKGRPDNPSPLTISTQNGSSRAGSLSVSVPVSNTNVFNKQLMALTFLFSNAVD